MKPEIIDIPGIGPAAAAALAEHGIKSVASLSEATIERITAIPGFSEARAAGVIAAAAELLATSGITPPAKDKGATSGKNGTATGKDKKDKKDKKNKGKGKGKDKKKNKDKKKGKK
jgi:hypothetical protein